MVEAMLEFMLGPMRGISDFYFENQAIFNPIVVGVAFIKIITHRRKSKTATEE